MKKLITLPMLFCYSMCLYGQVILIDPGHGGDDCGAKTFVKRKQKICEKEISLKMATLIKDELAKDFKVYLTRSIDREITLEQRAELADKIKANIFISVHANSSHYKSSQGFETYYLDNHNNVAVKKVESIENRGVKGEELIVNQILADLVVQKTAPQSRELGRLIHENISEKLTKKFNSKDRGAKPALFYVLALSKRPSVLLEAGFMSNKKDREKLLSEKYQKLYARGVAEGVRAYFKKFNNEPPLF